MGKIRPWDMMLYCTIQISEDFIAILLNVAKAQVKLPAGKIGAFAVEIKGFTLPGLTDQGQLVWHHTKIN